MLKVVPYTLLCRETIRALPDGVFYPVEGRDDYRRLLRGFWRVGSDFVLVEHDVAPTREQLAELEACDRPWCHFGYGPGDWTPTFGCVRFRRDLILGTPDAFADPEWPWQQLDGLFAVYARSCGFEPHWHYPHVLHLRTQFQVADGVVVRRRLTLAEESHVLAAELESIRRSA